MSYVFIFRIKNKQVPEYLQKNVQLVRDRTQRVLRIQDDFNMRRKNSRAAENSLFHNGLKLYNSLPKSINEEKSLNIFKKLLKSYIFQNV